MNILMLFWRGRLGGCFALVAVLLALLSPSSADGQWLEETIYLPDEFGGLIWPTCVAFDTVHNKVYYGGGTESLGDSTDPNELQFWIVAAAATTLERVAHVQVPGRVVALCLNPVNGKLYCSLDRDDVVCIIDCTTDSLVATIAIGHCPGIMCVNPDNNKVYVTNYRDVAVIDGNADTVLATLSVPGKPRHLSYASVNNTVYCGDNDGFITLIDGQADSIRAVLELDPDPSRIWAACWNPIESKYYCVREVYNPGDIAVLYVIDGLGDSLLAEVPLGRAIYGICYNSADNRLYCVNTCDSIWVIDCTADTVESIIQLPEYVPGRIVCSPQSSRLYCLPPLGEISFLQRVMVVDCAGDSFLKFIETGLEPEIFAYDPVHDRLHLLNHKTDDATVVDCGGDSVLTTVGLGFRPRRLAYASNENKVYCSGESFERVIAIDAETNRVVAEIPVGYKASDLCYNPALSKLYCVDKTTDTVTVIDCTTDSIVARVYSGHNPRHLAFSPVGGSKVYCANWGENIVSVIDCLRDSVIARVEIGADAWGLLVNTRENKVYCQAQGELVSIIDCEGDTFAGVCNTGGRVLAYNPVENKAYFGYDYMFVVDGVTDSVVAVLDTLDANWWRRGCFNDRDNKVYVAATRPPALMVIDGAADTVTALIEDLAGGYAASGMSYNRMNNKLYVSCSSDGFVVVLDGATDSILGTVAVGTSPWEMTWNPVQNRTYVVCHMGSCLSVIRDSMVAGVAENPVRKTQPMTLPAILRRGSSIVSRERLAILDCTGRRVAELRAGTRTELELPPGVYYALPRRRGPVRRLLVVD